MLVHFWSRPVMVAATLVRGMHTINANQTRPCSAGCCNHPLRAHHADAIQGVAAFPRSNDVVGAFLGGRTPGNAVSRKRVVAGSDELQCQDDDGDDCHEQPDLGQCAGSNLGACS